MNSSALILLVGVGVCLGAPFTSVNDVPEQYRKMIPQEALDFLSGLTDNDKIALKDWAKGHAAYRTEHEAIQSLKLRSPHLGEKAEKLHNLVKQKIESLAPEARAFASEMIDRIRRLQAQIVAGEKIVPDDLKKRAALALKKFNALSPSAKEDLNKQFPIINAVMENEKFKKLAESFNGPLN